MQRPPSFWSIASSCLCATAFAVAQPLFEILQRHPEFLSVRALEGAKLWIFSLGLSVGPALVLATTLWLLLRSRANAAAVVLGTVVGLSVGLTLLPPLWRAGIAPVPGTVLALGAAAGSAFAFVRLAALRRGIRWAWPAALLFAAFFLAQPSLRPLLRGGDSPSAGPVTGQASNIPVVVVVFDALPLSSLLDEEHEVDAALYPNFAALAAESMWFRMHTTSAERTLRSLPALLTGRRPENGVQPTLREHPRNLFTLLEGSHDLHIWEAITRLAPESAGAADSVPLSELLPDLGALYAHAVLPEAARHVLPAVDRGWRGFQWGRAGRGADSNRMVRGWREFVAGIGGQEAPALHFVHTILPHAPFLFTATGRQYSSRGMEPSGQGDYTGIRDSDEWAAIHSYQRHLLQLGFVDSLLGELLDALRRESAYDEAIVVVTADHGVSFRRDVSGRLAGVENMADILAVPLFLKLPHGERGGERIERGSESIDLLPTLMELLDIESEWELGGGSLLDPGLDRQEKISLGHRGTIRADKAEASAVEATVAEKYAWFRNGLLAPGPDGDLVGRELAEFEILQEATGLSVLLLRPGLNFSVADGDLLPAEVVGYLTLPGARTEPPSLAIALDGVIRAVTRPYTPEKNEADLVWSALLPEAQLGVGAHRLEILAIERAEGELSLSRIGGADELPSFLGRRLGDRIVVGVEETGFRRHKPHRFADYRWMDPTTTFRIPLREGERPRSLRIEFVQAAPGGSELALHVDDELLYEGIVPEAGFAREFSLEAFEFEESVQLRLECSSFLRNEAVEGMPRPREFGMALQGLWLQRRRVR